MGFQGKNLGLWDYTLFEIEITEISFEIGIIQKGIFHPCKIGITGLHPFRNWDHRITLVLKINRDYGITGPPYRGPSIQLAMYNIRFYKLVAIVQLK